MTIEVNRVICLIPARKGSQGLYKKNLRIVGFNTLVNRSIKVAKKMDWPVHIVLSTNDESILKRYSKKVDTCINRKTELSNHDSSILDVIQDALKVIPDITENDLFMILEPSSPNRNSQDLNFLIHKFITNNYSSLVTVSPLDLKYHPHKSLKIVDGVFLTKFFTNSPSILNRQEITEDCFYRDGVAYLYNMATVHSLTRTVPDFSNFVITNHPVSNIDTQLDLWIARYFVIKAVIFKLKTILRARRDLNP